MKNNSPGEKDRETPPPAIDIRTMSVLIVDDTRMMCKTIWGAMRVLKYGKVFHVAENGREGLSLLQKEHVDLAIVDWNMPVMNGGELLHNIRKDKNLREIPVVMLTVEANREIVAEAAESGTDAYLLKPFTVRSIGDKIKRVVNRVNHPPPMVSLLKEARDLQEARDIDGAIAKAHLAADADPESSKPLRMIGYYYLLKDDLKNAHTYLDRAVSMNRLDVFAFHYLGELYLKENDIEKAAANFDAAMRISPRHMTRAIHFGKILVEKGMTKRAISVFDKSLKMTDNALDLYEDIAVFCKERGIYHYSAKLLEFLISNTPGRNDLRRMAADTQEKIGEYSRAAIHLTEMEKKEPDDISVKLRLAKLYMRMKKTSRGVKMAKAVLKLDPKNSQAKKIIKSSG